MKIDFLLVNEIKQIYFETNFKHILTFQSLHSIIIQANAFKSMTSSTWTWFFTFNHNVECMNLKSMFSCCWIIFFWKIIYTFIWCGLQAHAFKILCQRFIKCQDINIDMILQTQFSKFIGSKTMRKSFETFYCLFSVTPTQP